MVQLAHWGLAGEEAWVLLLRDARITAALLLGQEVLLPPINFDPAVMLVASLIHFGLSILYAAALLPLRTPRRSIALLIGAGFGLVLYAVNLHGFTWLFPWFVEARGSSAIVAHVVFGMTAMEVLRRNA